MSSETRRISTALRQIEQLFPDHSPRWAEVPDDLLMLLAPTLSPELTRRVLQFPDCGHNTSRAC